MIMSSPEPMALGSPSQSPPSGNNQYLPQFLLGDMPNHNIQMNSRNPAQGGPKYWGSSNTGSSPPRSSMLNPSLGQMGMPSSSIGRSYSISAYDGAKYNMIEKQEPNYTPHYPFVSQNQNQNSPHERTFNSTIAGNTITFPGGGAGGGGGIDRAGPGHLPGAPPVNRLVDVLNKPTFGAASSNSLAPNDARNKFATDAFGNPVDKTSQDIFYTPTQSRISPPSPAQIDPFYNYGDSIKPDEKLDETWITIFGFPPSATSYVLQEFAVYGQILRHVPNSQGNWLHIQYQSKLQAQKALSKNGKVLANQLMVGVMPCIDKKVMDMYSQKSGIEAANSPANVGANGGSAYSPNSLTASGASKLPKTISTSRVPKIDRSQSLRTNVRPLGPYNRSVDPSAESLAASQAKLPKKNNNVISKAMEFMFGW